MLWIILSLLGVGTAAAYLKSQAGGTHGQPSDLGAEIGADEPPTHGRLAKCGKPGGGFAGVMKTIIHTSQKALFTAAAKAFTGGAGAKELCAFSDKLMAGPSGDKDKKKLPSGETMNAISNVEVAIVGLDVAREQMAKGSKYWSGIFAAARVSPASFTGTAEDALAAVFRTFFVMSGKGVLFPGCVAEHISQGVAILMYGPGAAEVCAQYRGKRPKTADGKPLPWDQWIARTVSALEDLKARREGAIDPAFGAEEGIPSDAALRAENTDAQEVEA